MQKESTDNCQRSFCPCVYPTAMNIFITWGRKTIKYLITHHPPCEPIKLRRQKTFMFNTFIRGSTLHIYPEKWSDRYSTLPDVLHPCVICFQTALSPSSLLTNNGDRELAPSAGAAGVVSLCHNCGYNGPCQSEMKCFCECWTELCCYSISEWTKGINMAQSICYC